MKISLSSFLYFNYPLEDAIHRTAAAGYDGIDIWGGRPHAFVGDHTERELLSLRRLIASEGLGVASFIPAQFRYPTSLCSSLPAIHRASIRYIQESIETASALGAPVVSICPGHTLYGQSKAGGLERLREAVWEICEYAGRHGMQIAIEPADRYETDLLNTCAETAEFIQGMGCQNLGILLDNGHALVVGESSVAVLHQLGGQVFHIHIDDNNGLRDQHLVPGDGVFDFTPFIAALNAAGYQGYLGAELGWDYTIDPDPAAQQTVHRLKAIFQTVQVS